jgi:hypothetical protein
MSCFFLYSALRRASVSAQVANPAYHLFELTSPHVTASAVFNKFMNRKDAEMFIRDGLGGVLDPRRTTAEQIPSGTASYGYSKNKSFCI